MRSACRAMWVGLLSLLLMGCAASPPAPNTAYWRYKQQYAPGTDTTEVVEAIKDDAWAYVPCFQDDTSRIDLFFFDSKSYDEANIVIVRSLLHNNTWEVDSIGTFDESNAWQAAFSNCIDRKMFD